jgi:hypothetical protein
MRDVQIFMFFPKPNSTANGANRDQGCAPKNWYASKMMTTFLFWSLCFVIKINLSFKIHEISNTLLVARPFSTK